MYVDRISNISLNSGDNYFKSVEFSQNLKAYENAYAKFVSHSNVTQIFEAGT